MKTIICIAVLLLSISAQAAGIQGAWQGWGQWTFDGDGPGCPDMRLSFKENNGALKRLGGYFDCGIAGLDIAEAEWQKQEGKLVVDGQIVGSYADNSYEYTEPYNEQTNVTTTIKVDGKHFDYNEIWIQNDGRTLYKIKGRFFFQNDIHSR